MARFTARCGAVLEVGRVDRRVIDRYVGEHPPPEPPTRRVEAWGGEVEDLPDYNDATYRARLALYNMRFWNELLAKITDVVRVETVTTECMARIAELRAARMPNADDPARAILYYLIDDDEATSLIELVWYLSTVTVRGIKEAIARFAPHLRGKPVNVFGGPRALYSAMPEFWDRLAAQWAGYTWEQFCELSGPEQSAIAATYRLKLRMEAGDEFA